MKPADDQPSFDDVLSLARRWYYTHVRELVEYALVELKRTPARDLDERDWLSEFIRESVEGHAVIIYTAQASMACAASDNEGAYEEEYGEVPETVEARAQAAMEADAWQLLEARRDEWLNS